MSCQLRLLITDRRTHYQRGDTISGKVLLDVSKPTQIAGLDLETFWTSSGEGSNDKSLSPKGCLFRGEIAVGHHEFDFSFEVNEPVYSYYGELFTIRWYIRASADIRWSVNPTDQQEYIYTPVDKYAQHNITNQADFQLMPALATLPKPVIWAGLAAAGVGGISFLAGSGGLAMSWLTQVDKLVLLAGVGAGTVYGASFLGNSHDKLSDVFIERTFVSLDRRTCSPGETFNAGIELAVARNCKPKLCQFELSCVEVAQQIVGTRQVTTEHITYLDTKTLPLPKTLQKNKQYDLSSSFTIPPGASQTFHAKNNRLEWRIELTIVFNRLLKWQEEGVIEVQYS